MLHNVVFKEPPIASILGDCQSAQSVQYQLKEESAELRQVLAHKS